MKDYVVSDFKKFLELVLNYDTPLKFFEINGEKIRAEANLRVMLLSFDGIKTEEKIQKLTVEGFTQVTIRETKPMVEV